MLKIQIIGILLVIVLLVAGACAPAPAPVPAPTPTAAPAPTLKETPAPELTPASPPSPFPPPSPIEFPVNTIGLPHGANIFVYGNNVYFCNAFCGLADDEAVLTRISIDGELETVLTKGEALALQPTVNECVSCLETADGTILAALHPAPLTVLRKKPGAAWGKVYSNPNYNAPYGMATSEYGDIFVTLTSYEDKAGIARSQDNGDSWTVVYESTTTDQVFRISSFGDLVLVASKEGVYRSADRGDTWTKILVNWFTNIERVNSYYLAFTGASDRYSISTDNGLTWTRVANRLPAWSGNRIGAMANPNGLLVAGSWDDVSYTISQDEGAIWSQGSLLEPKRPKIYVWSLGITATHIYIANYGTKVYIIEIGTLPKSPKQTFEMLSLGSLALSSTSRLVSCEPLIVPSNGSITLTLEATYSAIATDGIKVHVRGSEDCMSWGSEDWDSWTPTFTAGKTIRLAKNYETAPRFIKVLVENLDKVKAVANIKVTATLGGK